MITPDKAGQTGALDADRYDDQLTDMTRPDSDERSAMSNEKLAYSVTEVADLLSISRAAAYTYVRTGLIRSVSLGGRIIIPRRAIDELLDLDQTG